MIRTKPFKLRAACNQCHTTKVKCSGEKTGCSRCDNLGIECAYSESRVGRVPGTRRRKVENTNADPRMTGSPTDARVMGNTADSVIGEIANAVRLPRLSPRSFEDTRTGESIEFDFPFSSKPSPHPSDTEKTGPFDDAHLSWSFLMHGRSDDNFRFDERYAAELLGTLQDTYPELSQQPPQQLSPISQSHPLATKSRPSSPNNRNSLNVWCNESGHHEISPSPPSGTHNGREFPLRTPDTIITPQMKALYSRRDSQCVIACSQMIFSLEKYQVNKLKVLDLILGIVKRVSERLDPLVNGQLESPNDKCLNLFHTILFQLVEILEVGCADFLADTTDTSGSRSSSEILEAGFHEFDFGGLGMGYKDQERFQSQVILELLRPVIKIMQKVSFITTKAGSDRDGCYQDRETRLKTLVDKVKKRREGGEMIMTLDGRSDTAIY